VSVDLRKNLPTLQSIKIEIKEKKYIPLETTPEILLDKDKTIKYLSETICVITNRERGDVFIFNLDGKCVGSFNCQEPGPYGYQYIVDIVVDENKEEIFIVCGDIMVYTFEGKFLRKLYSPKDTKIWSIRNFNNTTLLASGPPHVNMSDSSLLKTTPYVQLSKQTGEVTGSLNVGWFDRQVLMEGWRSATPTMIKNGKDIYLSDFSSDTLYHIEQNGKLKPFLVRTPSILEKKPNIFFQVKDKFGSYLVFHKTINNFDHSGPDHEKFKMEQNILNMETGEMFKFGGGFKFTNDPDDVTIRYSLSIPYDVVANTIAGFADADILIDELKNGDVKSDELKKVVSALHEEDNPVLVIIKF